MVQSKTKILSSLCILFLCFSLSMFAVVQTPLETNQNIVLNTYSSTYIFEYQNNSYLISDATSDSDIIKIQKYLNNYNLYKFNYAICLNNTIANQMIKYSTNIVIFQKEILTKTEEESFNKLKENIKNTNLIILNYNKQQTINSLKIILLQENSSNYGIFIENLNTYFSLKNNLSNSEIININNNYIHKINTFFGDSEYFLIDNSLIKTAVLNKQKIYSNNTLQKIIKGNWTFTLNYDIIKNVKSLDY